MDIFNLAAKISLDSSEYEKGVQNASKGISAFGDKLKTGLSTAAKVGFAAVGAAAAGVAAVVKGSIDSFAEYEQLVGGVETLFKDSAGVVQEYAANAYKTAGLSANEYMETVTSFSASLLQSLGGDTEAAAHLADVAITDMSDNANKMGSSMESIQNAYQGFAKQNYTMLDNLKLGYGGTKTEMERLIADAENLDSSFKATRDENGDLAMSYADIVNAIHIVQTEMGITGTTALEASETISGSVASMKSAWANLVTGIADENANFDELVSNFVDSVATVMGNLLPRIETALSGVGELIEQLAPVIMEAIPSLVENVLPTLIESALTLVKTLVSALIENLPLLLDVGLQLILTLADGLIDALPELIPAIVDVILTIVEKLTEPDTVVKLIEAAFKIMVAIAEGLINAIPKLVEKVPEIIKNLLEGFVQQWPEIKKGGTELLEKFGEGIESALLGLLQIVDKVLTDITDKISGLIDDALDWGSDMIGNFIDGIKNGWYDLKGTLGGFADKIADFIGFSEPKEGPLSKFHTFAPDMMALFAQGIKDNEYLVTSQISQSFDFEPAFKKQQSGAVAGSVDSVANSDMAAVERILRQIYKEIADMPVKARMA